MNKLEIFRRFQQGVILHSCVIHGVQLKFSLVLEKGYKKVNTVALERLLVNILFLLTKKNSAANIVKKLVNYTIKHVFGNIFFMFLNMFSKRLTLVKLFSY